MNMLLRVVFALAVVAAGCSKPSSNPSPVRAKPIVCWFTNEQGFIVSDVKTNDGTHWSSPDGTQSGVHFDGSKEVHDPLENSPEFADAFRDAHAQADAATQRWAGQMGRVHLYWKKKKEVLLNKYRIDWRSPADLNPMNRYD